MELHPTRLRAGSARRDEQTRLPTRALDKVVLVLVTLAMVALPSTAGASDLEVADSEVSPGQSVTLTGSGFLSVAPVSLCWDHEGCSNLGRAEPGTEGSFTASVAIPDEATGGTYQIFACQQPAGGCASAQVRVAFSTTTSTLPTSTTTTSTTTSTTTTSTTTTTLASTTSTNAIAPTTSSTTTVPATSGGSQPPTSTTSDATAAPSTTAGTVASTTSSSEAADSTTSSAVPGGSSPNSTDGTPSVEVRSGSLSAEESNTDDSTVLGLAPLEWVAMVVVACAMVLAVWVFDSRKRSSRRRYILDLNRPGNRGL